MKTMVKNISFTRGNTYGLKIDLKTNITEIKEVYFTVKDSKNKRVIEKKLNDGITLNDKEIILQLKPKDTDNLVEKAPYKYDIQINYGISDEFTLIKGSFAVDWKVSD